MTVATQTYFIPPAAPDTPFIPVYLRSRLAEEMVWYQWFKERGIPDPVTVAPPHPTAPLVPVHKQLGKSRA